ncbi:MAG: TonB-dependent receptor [Holophagaceae bacterium]|nr:TonB-dependent receptor [Holophagaceae bacterium]
MAAGGFLHAQSTAAIRVHVRDGQGRPLAGYRVVLESVERGGQRQLVSDAAGIATASGLVPGRYRVQHQEVQLRADELAQVNLTGTEASATVAVEAAPFKAETSSVGLQTRLDAAVLDRLPLGPHRYVENSYLVPGITPSGKPEPVVLGSMLDANAFQVDGMSTNLSSTGRFGMNLSTEIVDSQVMTTGGHKAEVGFASGAVFNLVTKSGTNLFQGSVFGSLISRGLNAKPGAGKTNFPEERPTNSREFGFSVGGPLLKDKLFYFVSWNKQRLDLDFENVQPIGAAAPERRTQAEDREYRFVKLTWMASADHRLELSWFGDPVTQKNFDSAGNPALKDFQLPDRTRGGNSFLLKHVGMLGGALTWENTLGLHRTDFNWSPATPGAGPSRKQLDAPFSETFGQYPEERLEKIRNLTFKSEVSFYATGHQVKTGLQALWSDFTRAYLRPSGGLAYTDRAAGGSGPSAGDLTTIRAGLAALNGGSTYNYANGDSLATASPVSGQLVGGRLSYLYQRTLSDLDAYGNALKSKNLGVFAQDDWAFAPRWTAHLGLRADKVSVDGEDGRELYSETLTSPRLGLSWDPDGKGGARVFAYFGRIFSPPAPGNLRPAGATTDGPSTVRQVWIPSLGEWKTFASAGVVVPKTLALGGSLKAPKTDLIQFGGEKLQAIPGLGTWVLEGVLTYKKMSDLLDTYNPAWGYLQPSDVGLSAFPAGGTRVIANLPGLSRTYKGFDLIAHRSFEGGHRIQVSYTHGDLRGNSEVGGVAAASATNTGFAQVPSLRQDYRLGAYDGPLNENITHFVKAWGSARLPWELELSAFLQVRSGLRYSRLVKASGDNVLEPGATRGSEQLPWSRTLDLSLARAWKLDALTLRAALEVFNLTNDQPLSLINNIAPAFTAGNYQQPRVVQFSFRASF